MKDSKKEEIRKSYSQTDLVPVPVDTKYNIQLFKIRNVPEYENVVFVAPRLYAYGGAQHGHVAPHKNTDGTISLSLPFALITGIEPTITAADDSGPVTIPEQLLVHDLSGLKADLEARFGNRQTIAPLPGCPKKVTLNVNDQEYDVTPKDIANSNYCELNKGILAPLRVSEQDAKFIFQEALYAGSVQVEATFETLVAFTTSRVSIHFNKKKLFQEIEAELAVNVPPYTDVDVHAKLTKIVQDQALHSNIQGDMSGAVATIVDHATKLFFDSFRADPNSRTKECGTALVCLRFNYNHSDEKGEFSANWEQSTTTLNGQIITSWAKMQPVQDATVQIGGGGNRPALKNDGSSMETGLTVVPGAQLEIRPISITYEQRVLNIPQTTTAHNRVCVASQPTYEQKCVTRHHGGTHGTDDWETTECHQEQTGTQCTKYEDHWIITTTYSQKEPEIVKMDQPAGTIKTLYEGLELMFTWGSQNSGEFKWVTCPLNVFNRVGRGESLVVTLENKPGCNVFSEDSKNSPMVSLVNNIQFPVNYKDGKEVIQWDGKVLDTPKDAVYNPWVNFEGTVSVRGFDLMNVFTRSG